MFSKRTRSGGEYGSSSPSPTVALTPPVTPRLAKMVHGYSPSPSPPSSRTRQSTCGPRIRSRTAPPNASNSSKPVLQIIVPQKNDKPRLRKRVIMSPVATVLTDEETSCDGISHNCADIDLPTLKKRVTRLKKENEVLERQYEECCAKSRARRREKVLAKAAQVSQLEELNKKLKAKVEAMKTLNSDDDESDY
jgi:hypothetical protein